MRLSFANMFKGLTAAAAIAAIAGLASAPAQAEDPASGVALFDADVSHVLSPPEKTKSPSRSARAARKEPRISLKVPLASGRGQTLSDGARAARRSLVASVEAVR